MNINQTIYEAFKSAAENNLEKTALIYENKRFTYKHVLDKVNRIASSLNELGVKKDLVVTVMLPNIPMAIYSLYAINQIGAIANLVHPLMKLDQLREILKKTNSNFLILLDLRINEFRCLKNEGITLFCASPVDELNFFVRRLYQIKNKISHKDAKASLLYLNNPYKYHDKDYLKDSFYLHSGGTTGEAKTIALSSKSLNAVVKSGLKMLDITMNDVYRGYGMLATLPMFHGFGLCMGVHACLCYGAFDVLMPKFRTKQTIKYLKKGYIQTIIGVPVLFEALLRNKKFKGSALMHLDNTFVGGDFVSQSLLDRFNKRMDGNGRARLYPGYGLTETVTVCSVNTHTNHNYQSVGQPIEGVNIKAFDDDKELGIDEPGELYVSGDTLMNGYRFEKNKLNPFFIDKNNVKWVKTGDYGRINKDGYVIFMQRLKRIVKVSGVSVFPSEIENEIMHLANIKECYAKRIDDEKLGHMIRLYVVLNKKVDNSIALNEKINNVIKNKFGIYAVPKDIIYLRSLPKTLVGKVDEKKLGD